MPSLSFSGYHAIQSVIRKTGDGATIPPRDSFETNWDLATATDVLAMTLNGSDKSASAEQVRMNFRANDSDYRSEEKACQALSGSEMGVVTGRDAVFLHGLEDASRALISNTSLDKPILETLEKNLKNLEQSFVEHLKHSSGNIRPITVVLQESDAQHGEPTINQVSF